MAPVVCTWPRSSRVLQLLPLALAGLGGVVHARVLLVARYYVLTTAFARARSVGLAGAWHLRGLGGGGGDALSEPSA